MGKIVLQPEDDQIGIGSGIPPIIYSLIFAVFFQGLYDDIFPLS